MRSVPISLLVASAMAVAPVVCSSQVVVRPVVVQVQPQPAKPRPDLAPPPAATRDNPFPTYSDKSRGWHYKEPFPDDLEPEPLPAEPAAPPPPPQAEAPPTPTGPKPLSPAWIRENIDKYLDKAIEDPSPQNVSNYLYLQKYAMDAADRFSQVYRRVVLADANLDESASAPVWNGATKAMEASAQKATRSVIASLAKDWGLWFFFRSDCEPCHIQAPVLDAFAKLYKFSVLAVSIDGAPLPNSPFPRHVVDVGQAEKLGVKGTPTILLVKPPGTIIPLSYGMSSMPELEDRLIELAAQLGVITPEQYQSTRVDRKNPLPASGSMAGLDSIDLSNPEAVREFLKGAVASRPGK